MGARLSTKLAGSSATITLPAWYLPCFQDLWTFEPLNQGQWKKDKLSAPAFWVASHCHGVNMIVSILNWFLKYRVYKPPNTPYSIYSNYKIYPAKNPHGNRFHKPAVPGDKPGRAIRGLSKRVGDGAGNLSRLPWFFLGELDIHARSYPTLCKNWFKLITIHNKGTKTWWNCWPAHDCMGQHFAQGIQHHNNKHWNFIKSFLNNFGSMHSLMSISLHTSRSHGDGRGRTVGPIYLSSFRSLTAFDFMICMHAIIAGLLIPGWSNLIWCGVKFLHSTDPIEHGFTFPFQVQIMYCELPMVDFPE